MSQIGPYELLEVIGWGSTGIVYRAKSTSSGADVAVKRPGSGIPAKHLEEVVGRVAARDLPADQVLRWDDLV